MFQFTHRHTYRPALRALRGLLAGVALSVLSVGAVGGLAGQAHAQFGAQSSFAEAFQPEFLPRDMNILSDYLSLEDWQRPIIEMLLEDYNDSFRAGVESVRDEMREVATRLDGMSNDSVMDLVMGPVQNWMSERRRLGESFLNNVRSQLSDRQRQQWPAFERALRRDKVLPRGEISGESVNLFTIVRNIPLTADERSAIQPVLDRYAVQLDEALVARENVIRSLEDRLAQAMRTMDFTAGMAASDQIMAARVTVRTVQDQSAAEIEQALPAEHRADFRNRHRVTAYSKVYRGGGQMDRFFESIRAIEGLRDDQIASIDSIEIGYWEELESINGQMLDAVRAEEPLEARRRTEAIRARSEGQPVPVRDPSRSSQLMVERDALGEQTRKALLALLTPEQLAQLPASTKARLTGVERRPDDRGPGSPIGTSAPVQRGGSDDAERRQRANEGQPGLGTSGGRAGDRGARQPDRSLD